MLDWLRHLRAPGAICFYRIYVTCIRRTCVCRTNANIKNGLAQVRQTVKRVPKSLFPEKSGAMERAAPGQGFPCSSTKS